MRLSRKIWLSLTVLLVGYAASVTVSHVLNRRVVERTAYVWDSAYPVSMQAEEIVRDNKQLWALYRDAVLMGEADRIETAEALGARIAADIEALAAYQGMSVASAEAAVRVGQQLEALARESKATYNSLIQSDNAPSDALQEDIGELATRRRDLTRALGTISAGAAEHLKTQLDTIRHLSIIQSRVGITVFVLVLVVSLPLVSVSIRRLVLAPFMQILQAVHTGRMPDPATLPSDEIGEISRALCQLHDRQTQTQLELRENQRTLERRVEERTRELALERDRLRSVATQKDVLLKEVYHRVKNNLQIISSLLSLQSGAFEDERFIQALKDSQDRVSAIALVHEKLYQSTDLTQIDLAEYLNELTSSLLMSH